GDDVDASERGDRSDLPAHQGDEFVDDSVRIGRLGGVAENDEGAGDLALDLVMDPDDGSLGHSRVGGDDGLDDAGRQAVTGDVDDIVGAPHDVDVAVLVEVAGVAGEVVAVEGGQVRGDEARVIAPYRCHGSRRQWQPHDDEALLSGGHGCAVRVEDLHLIAGHRFGGGAGL